MSGITIYHNTQCGTSRNTLALIRNSGEEPKVSDILPAPTAECFQQGKRQTGLE